MLDGVTERTHTWGSYYKDQYQHQMTGSDEADYARQAFRAGAHGFMIGSKTYLVYKGEAYTRDNHKFGPEHYFGIVHTLDTAMALPLPNFTPERNILGVGDDDWLQSWKNNVRRKFEDNSILIQAHNRKWIEPEHGCKVYDPKTGELSFICVDIPKPATKAFAANGALKVFSRA